LWDKTNDARMIDMNVTAKHGQAAVHLGGHEMANGRWSPACGIQHHNAGGREVTPLRPTDKPVDCKRCLRTLKADKARTDQAEAVAARKAQARENIKTTRKSLDTDHKAAVATMYANIAAEEEKRAAARRARNRTNYAKDKSGMDSLLDMLKLY
jgi:hypothetical protein